MDQSDQDNGDLGFNKEVDEINDKVIQNGEIEAPKTHGSESSSRKFSRKLSRRMIMAYYHEDGQICPRTIKQHCPDHGEEDMNNPEILVGDDPSMNLNSVPGFPGVGGFGYSALGGYGGAGDGMGMPGMNFSRQSSEYGGFGQGMGMGFSGMGGMNTFDVDMAGLDGGLDLESLGIDADSDIGKLLASDGADGLGDMGDMSSMMGMGPGMGGMNPMMGMGPAGMNPMMSMANGMGGMSPMMGSGMGGLSSMLGPGGKWPYDQATQMQLSGMNPELVGQYGKYQQFSVLSLFICP